MLQNILDAYRIVYEGALAPVSVIFIAIIGTIWYFTRIYARDSQIETMVIAFIGLIMIFSVAPTIKLAHGLENPLGRSKSQVIYQNKDNIELSMLLNDGERFIEQITPDDLAFPKGLANTAQVTVIASKNGKVKSKTYRIKEKDIVNLGSTNAVIAEIKQYTELTEILTFTNREKKDINYLEITFDQPREESLEEKELNSLLNPPTVISYLE